MRYLILRKSHLLLAAGLIWCVAGSMVCIVGIPLEVRLAPTHLVLLPLAAGIFAAFYAFVFSRLVRLHTARIRGRAEEALPVWQLFPPSSWAVMALMMGGGVAIRASHLAPDWAIAFFYTGLGAALFLCGLRLVGASGRGDAVRSVEEEAAARS